MEPDDAERQIVIAELSSIPYAGKLTGELVSVLWPDSGNAVWSSLATIAPAVRKAIEAAR